MLRIGPLEYLGSLRDQFDELAAEFHVGAFGVLVSGQVAAQLPALLFEQVEPLPEEVLGNELVKAIVVEAVHQDLLLCDLRPDFLDDGLVVGALFLPALRRLGNQDGQAPIEYALIVTLIVVVVLVVIIAMGSQVHTMYCNITGGFPS